MRKWHPLTKILLACSALAVPYLLWSAPEPTPATAPASAVAAALRGREETPPAPLVMPGLPPLAAFGVTVERPLFSPSRRLAAMPPAVVEMAAAPAVPDGPSGPEEPLIRFFGTMGVGGRMTALVAIEGESAPRKLASGDAVGDWTVEDIERDTLRLALGTSELEYKILQEGGAPSAAGAGAQRGGSPGAVEEGEDFPDAELGDDEGEP